MGCSSNTGTDAIVVGSILNLTSSLKVFAKNICLAKLVKTFYLVGIIELVRNPYKLGDKEWQDLVK